MSDSRLSAAKFRKKPVVIEAMQWDGTASSAGPIIDWVLRNGGTIRYRGPEDVPGSYLSVDTLEGTMYVDVGDWVIRGVQGEFYPCKPAIFAATYEAVES